MTRMLGGGDRTLSPSKSLACEPTHRQGLLSLKRILASTGAQQVRAKTETGLRSVLGGAGGGGRGRAGQGTRCVGLDWMLPLIHFLLINPHSWRRNIYVGSHRGNLQTGRKGKKAGLSKTISLKRAQEEENKRTKCH